MINRNNTTIDLSLSLSTSSTEYESIVAIFNSADFCYIRALFKYQKASDIAYKRYDNNRPGGLFITSEDGADDLAKIVKNLMEVDQQLQNAIQGRFITIAEANELANSIKKSLIITNQFALDNLKRCSSQGHLDYAYINPNSASGKLFEDLSQNLKKTEELADKSFRSPESRSRSEAMKNTAYFITRQLMLGSLAVLVLSTLALAFYALMLVGSLGGSIESTDSPIEKRHFQLAWGSKHQIQKINLNSSHEKLVDKIKPHSFFWAHGRGKEMDGIQYPSNQREIQQAITFKTALVSPTR